MKKRVRTATQTATQSVVPAPKSRAARPPRRPAAETVAKLNHAPLASETPEPAPIIDLGEPTPDPARRYHIEVRFSDPVFIASFNEVIEDSQYKMLGGKGGALANCAKVAEFWRSKFGFEICPDALAINGYPLCKNGEPVGEIVIVDSQTQTVLRSAADAPQAARVASTRRAGTPLVKRNYGVKMVSNDASAESETLFDVNTSNGVLAANELKRIAKEQDTVLSLKRTGNHDTGYTYLLASGQVFARLYVYDTETGEQFGLHYQAHKDTKREASLTDEQRLAKANRVARLACAKLFESYLKNPNAGNILEVQNAMHAFQIVNNDYQNAVVAATIASVSAPIPAADAA